MNKKDEELKQLRAECVNDVEPEYSATKVVACCKKKRNYHKNFIWVYHGETPVIPDRR